MLNRVYRVFILLGIAVGVVTGIFFLCTMQNQLRITAERDAVRRENEKSAVIYRSPKDVGENVLLATATIEPETWETVLRLLPKDWQAAPVVSLSFRQVRANQTEIPDATEIYFNDNYLAAESLSLAEGRLPRGNKECAISQTLAALTGLTLSGSPTLEVAGTLLTVTGIFSAPPADFAKDAFAVSPESGSIIFRPLDAAESKNAACITVKRPDTLSAQEFRARLTLAEQEINGALEDSDYSFYAQTAADLYNKMRPTSGFSTYLGIAALAFLGELLAAVNVMSLARAAILEHRAVLGVKLALGASFAALYGEFLRELLLLCAKGILLGLSVASVLIYLVNDSLTQPNFLFDVTTLFLSALTVAAACLLASYIPFRSILKEQPIRLLREER